MASKRKSVCIDEKVSLIRAIEKGDKKSDVAKRFGFSPSTVSTIWKNKEKFLQAEMDGKSSKKLKKPKFEDLDQAMLTWFRETRQNNMPVSGPIIKAKAEKFAEQLCITDFKASEGWLGKFKQRHCINYGAYKGDRNVRKIDKLEVKIKRIYQQYKSPALQSQNSYDTIDEIQFDKCKLSLKSPTTPTSIDDIVNNRKNREDTNRTSCNEVETENHVTDNTNEEITDTIHNVNNLSETDSSDAESRNSVVTPDVVRCLDNYTEDELVAHKDKLEELQLRQKIMEEQNKKRKEMLAKALADRAKQTEEEVQRLEKIKKQLQILDGQFSLLVVVLRKKIDQAGLSYSEAEKHYIRVQKDFLQAKKKLQKEKEKKELLTEHLCALITHNETRKAQKLETLMFELAADKNNSVITTSTPTEVKTVIIDGVDGSAKMEIKIKTEIGDGAIDTIKLS